MQDDVKELKTMVRAVINAQSAMKAELIVKIDNLENKVDSVEKKLSSEMKKGFKEVNNRCDLLGKQLNALDEDAPTSEDFNNLGKRVTKLEKYKNLATA